MCDGRRLLPVGRKGTAHGAHRAHGAHGAHSVHDGTEPMVPTEPTVPMDPTVARSPWRHGAHGAHGAHGSTEPTVARLRVERWHQAHGRAGCRCDEQPWGLTQRLWELASEMSAQRGELTVCSASGRFPPRVPF